MRSIIQVLVLVVFMLGICFVGTAQERQPSRIYTVEIHGVGVEKFPIVVDGWMKLPNGAIIKIAKQEYSLPFSFHADADRQIRLKIRPSKNVYEAGIFYEHGNFVQKRNSIKNSMGEGLILNIEPYADDN